MEEICIVIFRVSDPDPDSQKKCGSETLVILFACLYLLKIIFKIIQGKYKGRAWFKGE